MKMRSLPVAITLVAVAVIAAGCLPPRPAAGRSTPVRKVELIGDSLTWGLFGTTPGVADELRADLARSHISLTMDGGPGDTLDTPWPGHSRWADQLQARITADDPDVVVIQSILFPNSTDAASRDAYRAAAVHLFDIAQSRGAHVYVVAHHRPDNATEFHAADVAEELQAEAAAGRGIVTIPLHWWVDHCRTPFAVDGWHFSADGERCWAAAANAAVNQLRNAVG